MGNLDSCEILNKIEAATSKSLQEFRLKLGIIRMFKN